MKRLINQPEAVVDEMIEGLVAIHPGLSRLADHTLVLRSDAAAGRYLQVALISGGGSGHEPAHAGYVGKGMLSAAVAGQVFTSPSPNSVLAAIRAVTGKPGALLIVKNYTGDRLNFGLAAEMARAEGIVTEIVVVADDVALAAKPESAGRRGIAGTVLVHKVAGAAATEGKSLAEVAAIAQATAGAVGTMGVALSSCTVPAAGKPTFMLGEQEVELGLGIHGEPGVRRAAMHPADQLVDELLTTIFAARDLHSGERVALLVNNLGGTTTMELAIVARRASTVVASRGLVVERVYAGTFLSSLEMAGVSISVLQVDDDRLKRLDALTEAPAWPNVMNQRPAPFAARVVRCSAVSPSPALQKSPQTVLGKRLKEAILAASNALLSAEDRLTLLDQAVGDGDLGINMARAARAVQAQLPFYMFDDPAAALKALAMTLQESVGGTSGPLYGTLFLRLAERLRGGRVDDPVTWAEGCESACEAISKLGGATAGDRTMLDALIPFTKALQATLFAGKRLAESLAAAVRAAEEGANAAASMIPRRGRSSYLGERCLGHPDPGAEAVVIWLRAVVPLAGGGDLSAKSGG